MEQQHYYPPSQGTGYSGYGGGYPVQNPGYPQGGGYPVQNPGYLQGGGYPGAVGGYPAPAPTRGGWGRSGQQPGMSLAEAYDYEEGPERNFFVKRVFLILSIQLAFTATFVLFCMQNDEAKSFFRRNFWIMFAACGLYLIASISIQCCPLGRITPWNYLCLMLATFAMSVTTAGFAVRFKTHAVFASFGITCALCIVLMLLACSSFDFTRYLLFVVVFGVVLSLFGLALMLTFMFFKYVKTVHMIYAGVSSLFLSMMFVIELQMILGGRSVELEPTEYVAGALMLYTSIIQLFLNILTLSDLF